MNNNSNTHKALQNTKKQLKRLKDKYKSAKLTLPDDDGKLASVKQTVKKVLGRPLLGTLSGVLVSVSALLHFVLHILLLGDMDCVFFFQ